MGEYELHIRRPKCIIVYDLNAIWEASITYMVRGTPTNIAISATYRKVEEIEDICFRTPIRSR